MEQHIPPSSLEPIKKPIYEHTKKPVDKTKYLDEHVICNNLRKDLHKNKGTKLINLSNSYSILPCFFNSI